MSTRRPDSFEITLFPRFIPKEWSGMLQVAGEYAHTRLTPATRYPYTLTSQHWSVASSRGKGPVSGTAVADADGVLEIPFDADTVGEWRVEVGDTDSPGRHFPATLGVYVVDPALSGLRPYLGEFHCHSTGSDGRQEPAYAPIRAREWGLDFLALTDHRNFATSRQMIEGASELLGPEMLLLTGEEMHPEATDVPKETNHRHGYHFVSVGTPSGILDAMRENPDGARAEIQAIADEIAASNPVTGLDLDHYAEAVWKSRLSRSMGGLVLFCHPFWAWPVNLDDPGMEQSFRDREFDAVEVLSRADSSSLMPNRWVEEVSDRGPLPVVGVSDNHSWGPETALTQCSVVFASELTQQALFDAVRANRSLAFEASTPPRLVGPSHLVELAEFHLLRILPIKRQLTALEAGLAFSGLRGEVYDRGVVDQLARRQERLDRMLWAD